MLELRPTCEHCNKALPPSSLEAQICTFECTFCATCVTEVLGNVCPNCGGGFVPRPIRPAKNWKGDNYSRQVPCQRDRQTQTSRGCGSRSILRPIKKVRPSNGEPLQYKRLTCAMSIPCALVRLVGRIRPS
jgi:hypothetical protein